MIFQYCEWLVKEYPEEGLSVFIDDFNIDEAAALPREKVLDFLEHHNSNLVIPYLEHCIFKWNEQKAKFHDTLINKYREKIRQLFSEYQLEHHQQMFENRMEILLDDEIAESTGDENSSMTKSRDNLPIDMIAKDYFLRPEPAGQEPDELGEYRRKLIRLLEESKSYNTEMLPIYLLHDGLFDERAIVMGEIGNHKEALVIYVHVLQDLQRAEEYCLKQYYRPDVAKSCSDVFLILLEQCLISKNCDQLRLRNSHFGNRKEHLTTSFISNSESSVGDERFGDIPANVWVAIAILSRHSDKIDLRRALQLLPADLPLSAIISILIQSLEHLNSRGNYLKVLR